jgi:hypothetical protein
MSPTASRRACSDVRLRRRDPDRDQRLATGRRPQAEGAARKRAEDRLRPAAGPFPDLFAACFRQEAHEKDRIWQLLADGKLPETIAAWTVDMALAKSFKGGVPPEGHQGVIFALTPNPDQVTVNLVEVYAAPAFHMACEVHREAIAGFASGIGKYGNSQAEVVLEVETLGIDAIFSYGGFSSPVEQLAAEHYAAAATPAQLADFAARLEAAGTETGAWWLSEAGTRNVLARIVPRLPALQSKKAR